MTAGDPKPADPGRQETKTLRIALLGCGSVGSQVARLLQEQADDLAVRTGARLELAGIAVRRPAHPRAAGIDRDLLTADAGGLATRPDVDIVVRHAYLPSDLAPGDLLAVAATGAYCRSISSNYNHVPRPPVVAVRDGQARPIVRRETLDDLLRLDVG